jgi:hypothetical protein
MHLVGQLDGRRRQVSAGIASARLFAFGEEDDRTVVVVSNESIA